MTYFHPNKTNQRMLLGASSKAALAHSPGDSETRSGKEVSKALA